MILSQRVKILDPFFWEGSTFSGLESSYVYHFKKKIDFFIFCRKVNFEFSNRAGLVESIFAFALVDVAWAEVKPINTLGRKVLIGLSSAHANDAKANILLEKK